MCPQMDSGTFIKEIQKKYNLFKGKTTTMKTKQIGTVLKRADGRSTTKIFSMSYFYNSQVTKGIKSQIIQL